MMWSASIGAPRSMSRSIEAAKVEPGAVSIPRLRASITSLGATSLICAGTLVLVSRSWEGVFVGQGGKAVTMTPQSLAPPMLAPRPEPVEASA